MSFEKFVIAKLPLLIQEQRWFYGPQYDFFYENGENKADFIGKFESLQTDFAKVCKALNMPVQNLPHRNKSAQKGGISGLRKFGRRFVKQPESLLHLLFSRGDKIKSKDYRDYYTPGLIAAVEELYKEDVAAFDYSFED